MSLINLPDVEYRFVRFQFNVKKRTELYSTLSVLLENDVMAADALNSLYEVHSEDGRKPNRVEAQVLADMASKLRDGSSLSEAFKPWVSEREVTLIATGDQSGRYAEAFERCISILSTQAKLAKSVKSALVYPSILLFASAVMLYYISTSIVPAFAKLVTPDLWTGAARNLYLLSYMTTNYGVFVVILIAILIGLFIWYLPRKGGKLRVILDRYPPFSLYRMLNGTTFMLNVAALLVSGVSLKRALEYIGENSSPWMKNRIENALYGIHQGKNLGEALIDAEQGFPDRETIRYVALLSDKEGFSTALENASKRWTEAGLEQVKAAANVMFYFGIIVVGMLIGIVALGLNDLNSLILSRSGV